MRRAVRSHDDAKGTARSLRGVRSVLPIAGALLLSLALASPALAVAGQLDTTFGGDGKVTNNINGWARAVVIQADGKIVAAGSRNEFGDDPMFALTRYNTDGSLDTTFGGDGKVFTNFTAQADWGLGAAIQADGKIVVAGGSATFTR